MTDLGRGRLSEYFHVSSAARLFVLIALLGGLVVRVLWFVGSDAFWIDEIALVRNILERSMGDLLFHPLDYYQAAPVGFLALEKLMTLAFGGSEIVLRLLPFYASVASLLLFERVADRLLGKTAAALAVLLFAFTPMVFMYAAQAKQYSSDLFFSVLLTWIASREDETGGCSRSFCLRFAAAGVAGYFFSHTAMLVFAGLTLGLALFSLYRRRLGDLRYLGWMSCGAFGAAALITVLHCQGFSQATYEYMHRFWKPGFFPMFTTASIGETVGWPVMVLVRNFQPVYVAIVLLFLGIPALWGRRRSFFLVVSVCFAALAASAARIQPLVDRQLLFLYPQLLVLMAAVVDLPGAKRVTGAIRKPVRVILASLVLSLVYGLIRNPPVLAKQEMKKIFAFVQESRSQNDPVYVYFGARPAVEFYGPSYGLVPGTYVVGKCNDLALPEYLTEINQLIRSSQRIWIIITNSRPSSGYGIENVLITGYLTTIGYEKKRLFIPGATPDLGAQASLFELVGPLRSEAELTTAAKDYLRELPLVWKTPAARGFFGGIPCREGPENFSREQE